MTHIAKLKLLPRTTMKAKGATRLVGQVTGGEGIDVTKTAGNFEVALNLAGFNVVQGPVAGTDNAVARWDGPDGRQLQDSLVSIADDGEMTVPALAGVTDIDTTTRATIFEPYIYQIQAIDDDGASDQSAAIQAQIDYCEANGICEAVFPPYKIRCWPIVSHPIKLRGTGVRIAMGVLADGQPTDVGTRLYRTAADTAQYGIDILSGANGATIEGICFLEEHAADGLGFAPTAYKAAIRNKSPWTTVRKNVFWGCYDGIQLGDGADFEEPGSGYVTIEDNAFACFHAGVNAYKCGDWCVAKNNWFQGYFVEDLTYWREYIRANASAYYLGRTDSFQIIGGGVYYWQYGVLTYINPDGPTPEESISERLKIIAFDMDKVHVGLYLVARVTGDATGCAIISDNGVDVGSGPTTGSFGVQGNASVLFSLLGCRFLNHGLQAVIAAEANCTIKMIGCLIRDAGLDGGGVTALSAAGSATIERSLCTFIGSASIEGGAGTYVTTATIAGTETLTGKTFDTAGAGNVFKVAGNTINNISGTGNNVLLSSNPEIAGALRLAGSTSQVALLQATAVAGNVTLTLPAVTGTISVLGATETFTGVKTFGSAGAVGRLKIAGTTSGTITLDAAAVAGTNTLTLPAATDTLVGRNTTDTLTLKTINSASGVNTIQFAGQTANNFSGTGNTILFSTNPEIGGALRLAGSSSQVVLLQATAVAGNATLTLPAVDGTVALTLNIGVMRFIKTAVNFNSANTDNAVTITLPTGITRYLITRTMISNASASISTATVGVFTATGGGGQTIAANQAITVTATAADTNNNAMQLSATNANTMAYNDTTLYVRVGTAQGSAATADVIIDIYPLT
jgi:hypothetical protein